MLGNSEKHPVKRRMRIVLYQQGCSQKVGAVEKGVRDGQETGGQIKKRRTGLDLCVWKRRELCNCFEIRTYMITSDMQVALIPPKTSVTCQEVDVTTMDVFWSVWCNTQVEIIAHINLNKY